MPPTTEALREILAVATSREELAYFYDQLKSPDWLGPLRELDLFRNSPEPIEDSGGVMFPGWPLSRYLVRIAGEAPVAVAEVLREIKNARNPRVWLDIAKALENMPPEVTIEFLPEILRWIHSPYRLGIDNSATNLAHLLIEAGRTEAALAMVRSFAMLIAPADWPADEPWLTLDEYDYAQELPPLGRELAVIAPDVVTVLADEWQRWFDSAPEGASATRYSSTWRPAIEDHEQNWNHERRENALVVTIRDAASIRIAAHLDELSPIVTPLLARSSVILRRIGIHLLVAHGDMDLDLVGSVLTNTDYMRDTEVHHEFYRLAQSRFGQLPPNLRHRYLDLVEEISADRETGESRDDSVLLGKLSARRLLSPIHSELTGPASDRYEALLAEFAETDHPDLLFYHSSWTGPTSPLSKSELGSLSVDEVVAYLETWRPESESGPSPSREGLARELGEAAKADPERFAPLAGRLGGLAPTFAGWLLLGFRDAIRAEKSFDLGPSIELCSQIVTHGAEPDEPEPDGSWDDGSWRSARLDAARFLETVVEDRPGQLGSDDDGRVWELIAGLLEDPDPTPDSETRYGPPNMDALTYSLNTTRGTALHAAVGYIAWLRRHSSSPDSWRLADDFSEGARALEGHLTADIDPSLAIAAGIGMNLSRLIAFDRTWVSLHIHQLLGDLTETRQRAAWDAYLLASRPGRVTYTVLQDFYIRFARYLSSLDEPPGESTRESPEDRFIAHVVVLSVNNHLPPEGDALSILVAAPKPWLLKAIVEEAGQIARSSGELDESIAASFRELWGKLRTAAEASDALRSTLGGFAWWFASTLDPDWTLVELVRLLETGVAVDPVFLIFPRLSEAAGRNPTLATRALDQMVPSGDDPWQIRIHEEEIREVLRAGLAADDALTSARAESLVHRFGRFGLLGLGSLLGRSDSVE